MEFHSHVVYVDESGDHGFEADKNYPLFVLAACVFEHEAYFEASRQLQQLKFKYFGHDLIHLHERDIRKASGVFGGLRAVGEYDAFMGDLTQVIVQAEFSIVAVVVRKDLYNARPWMIGWTEDESTHLTRMENVYHASTYTLLRVLIDHLDLSADSPPLQVIFEERGKREDKELTQEFHRVRGDGQLYPPTQRGRAVCAQIGLANKGNYAGLELADLVARPIGLHVWKPDQTNRAWDIIEDKIARHPR